MAKFPGGEVTGTRQHIENPCYSDRICATLWRVDGVKISTTNLNGDLPK